jgi:hypothetical protein
MLIEVKSSTNSHMDGPFSSLFTMTNWFPSPTNSICGATTSTFNVKVKLNVAAGSPDAVPASGTIRLDDTTLNLLWTECTKA